MSQAVAAFRPVGRARSQRAALSCAYAIEALTSGSVSFLQNGVMFFTAQQLGWATWQTLLLMMAQGVVYALGALSAGPLARRFAKTRLLLSVNATMLVLTGALALGPGGWLVPVLLLASFVSTLTWPLVESLVTEGCDAHTMSRRVMIYNITWSLVGVSVIAAYGSIMVAWPRGPMLIPVMCHVIGLMCAMVLVRRHRAPETSEEPEASKGHQQSAEAGELAGGRKMALWLGRVGLPASFVVANGLMGMMPKLRVSQELGVIWTTVLASLWMASRFVTFIVLGRTKWWHSRPRLLAAGAVIMLASFLLISLPGDRIGLFGQLPLGALVAVIALAEVVLGAMACYMFSASLYFGMVLSDGSADHGGYHESLIGLGMVIGPGIAAGAQWLGPENTRWPAIAAVTAMMVLTVGAMLVRIMRRS